MNLSTVLAFARAQVLTDSNGLTDANGIIFANEALNDLHRKLVNKGVDASQLQESYTDASVPSAGNGSTFLYPTNMLFLKTIELNYTDTSANNYRRAEQVDVANLAGGSSFSWLRGNANRNAPQFDDHGDWFEVFPAFTSGDNISQAIRIIYYLAPTLYTASSDTVAYPENLDAALLGWRVAANYLYSLGTARIADGDKFNAKYEERVTQYISTLARGSQQPLQAQNVQLTGFEF